MTAFDLTVLMIGAGLMFGVLATIRDFWRLWRNQRGGGAGETVHWLPPGVEWKRPADADEAPGDVPFVHPRIHAAEDGARSAPRKPQSEASE